MEADLLAYYRVDLRDFYRGTLTLRRVKLLIAQLPSDSRTALAAHGTSALWDLQANLTAVAIDELRAANWQRANEGKKTPSPYPKPLPRPGLEPRRRKGLPLDELRAWSAQWNPPGQEVTNGG